MPHVLTVAAREVRDPVAFLVLVVSDDPAFHTPPSRRLFEAPQLTRAQYSTVRSAFARVAALRNRATSAGVYRQSATATPATFTCAESVVERPRIVPDNARPRSRVPQSPGGGSGSGRGSTGYPDRYSVNSTLSVLFGPTTTAFDNAGVMTYFRPTTIDTW